MFDNLRDYDGQLPILESSNFDVEITSIPDGLEKFRFY